jgi:quinol monooxygenase YgiN
MYVPPEKTKEFLQTMLFIIKSVREEPGCLSYHFYQDMEEKNKFRLVGKWTRQEDMYNHLRSDIFSILLGAMNLLKESPDIKFYVASCTASGMEPINMVRRKTDGSNLKLLRDNR